MEAAETKNIMNEQDYEWVSVSTFATRINVSVQTIYNRIAQGLYPKKTYKRKSMNGILVGVPKDNL